MNQKRMLQVFFALLLSVALLAGCGQAAAPAPTAEATPAPSAVPTPSESVETPEPAATPAPISLRVGTLKGPTGMGMVKLMQDAEAGTLRNSYEFSIEGAPDVLAGKLISGETDIAALPINLAATLYNKTQGEIVMVAVNTLGVLYVLEDGESIQSVADLAGKTLYATGQGSTPEFILNYLLEKNGVKEDVTVEYKAEHAELATLLGAGEVTLGMLPEPNVTATMLKNDKLRIALDLTEEWNKISDGTPLVQGCIVVRKELVLDYPDAISTFLSEYAESTLFTQTEPKAAAELIAQYEIMGSAAAAEKAIPKCNIVYLDGEDMQMAASAMIEVLFQSEPKSVGGTMPDRAFYQIMNVG